MSCKCIEKIEKKLRDDTGDNEAELVTGYNFPFANKSHTVEVFIPIQVKYRQKKKDGNFGNKKQYNIMGAYCPFCGKKLQGSKK